MPKNLVYCADGTWNEPEEEENGVIAPSNVYKLYLSLQKNDKQVVEYEKGVGTASSLSDLINGGAFGRGIFKKIQDGYEFLSKHYEAGDRIYLFGFSRGAYSVRALAKIIEIVGLTKMDKCVLEPATNCIKLQSNDYCDTCSTNSSILSELKYIFSPEFKLKSQLNKIKQYNRKPGVDKKKFEATPYNQRLKQFQNSRKAEDNIKIEFVGLWDTVEKLGFNYKTFFINWRYKLDRKDIKISNHLNIKHLYHALAIDENRRPFLPTLVNEAEPSHFESIKQVWFTGAHSNIGGGYKQTSLSNNTLNWMAEQAQNNGLIFDANLLNLFAIKPNAKRTLRNELEGIPLNIAYWPSIILKVFKPIRNIQYISEKANSKIIIAESVYQRLEADSSYRPKKLPKKEEVVLEKLY